METEVRTGTGRRRVHTQEFKERVVGQCRQAGASVAAVALAHGVNANLVRKWLMGRGFKAGGLVVAGDARAALGPKKALAGAVRSEAMRFVPVGVAEAVSAAQTAPMEIELRRGDASLMVRWPTGRAQDCPAWLGAVAEAVLKR